MSPPYSALLRRCYSVVATVAQCKISPENFSGVYTKFGWVLVPKTHIARGWTQPKLNDYLSQHIQREESHFEDVQPLADQWVASVDTSSKPVMKKKTAAEARHEEDMKLFLRQLKGEEKPGEKKKLRASRVKKNVLNGDVTFTHAWNYFMAKQYPLHKHLSELEARSEIGLMWRLMSMDEKDIYRQEYSQLLQQGKDIYHGKIVDREVKLKAVERLNLSKEKSLARKMKKLEETQKNMHEE